MHGSSDSAKNLSQNGCTSGHAMQQNLNVQLYMIDLSQLMNYRIISHR
jgi:hypothetical protein